MKKKVLALLAPGFEEIEAITVVDILRRAGIEVLIIGLIEGPIKGSRGIQILADLLIDQAVGMPFDMVFLPGGMEGVNRLGQDHRVKQIIETAIKEKIWIAAICAAPSLLTNALAGKKATSHPCVQSLMNGVDYQEARVVVDSHFVTSRSPGTAMEFAFELVRQLVGDERVRAVNEGIMAI